MLTKRIIPCLDFKEGRVVKGVNFINLKDAGDPVALAAYYDAGGADELVFLDISATVEGRKTMLDKVQKTGKAINIPFTVGGGINSIEDMKRVLEAGANKVSLNTAAVLKPDLITEGVNIFGSQCIVIAIDAKFNPDWDTWEVYTQGGNKNTGLTVLDWAREVAERGAGEILLTSIDYDGQKRGYDLELTKAVKDLVSIPIIASGGAGAKEDFLKAFQEAGADGALAASVFHYGETSIIEIKRYLKEKGIPVRWID